MRTRKYIIWFLVLFLIFYSKQDIKGQYSKTYSGRSLTKGLSLMPKVGVNAFYGDLVDESRASYSLGFTADREMAEFFTLRASIMGGQMTGRQMNPTYNLPYAYFTNVYADLMFGATYKPLNHLMGYFRERTFEPYALLQLGFVFHHSKEYWGEAAKQVTPGAGEDGDVWRTATGFPPAVSAGGGVNIWLGPSISANLEFHGNLVFSDKLDAHDVWYSTYPDGEVNKSAPFDFYYIVSAGVVYHVENSLFKNHPKYSRASYLKARRYYKTKNKKVTRRRPTNHRRKKFLFF